MCLEVQEGTGVWRKALTIALDSAMIMGFFVLTLATPPPGGSSPALMAGQGAVLVLVSAAMIVRRRAPREALVVSSVGQVIAFAWDGGSGPLDLAPLVALYTLVTRVPRRQAWLIGGVTAAALGGARTVFLGQSMLVSETLAQIAWVGMVTAAGDAVRSRRAYVAAIEERARRAEETREEEAERRVMQERLRIARELHDVLAHHIALMNVQAQVAEHLLDSDVGKARAALGHVRRAGREVLGELRTTVGLLRSPGSADELPAEPSPGLDRLHELVSSFTAAGMPVDLRLEGVPASPTRDADEALPAPVELAAFRIVQEALTNVSKHASAARVRVRLARAQGEVIVEIRDDGSGGGRAQATGPGGGHGLIGMRERALSLGGRFSAGPLPDGGFGVQAVLPDGEAGR
ncbi:sensor histidine kinase [Nonomuraea basaltis]|uniref:sensor histidine kinase n=1 Tax=Nonomuraea basaltis TaxID=2495887 RepID=UPI001486F122|nr:histidine kinase [Nonomuraea basaltis]